MRRMFDKPGLEYPNEDNKVFCAQFVADEVVVNNLTPGLYAIELIFNSGDNSTSSLEIFNFKFESTYGSIVGKYFYDYNNYRPVCLVGEYSGNSKTITFTIVDASGNTIKSPTDLHIDIYKI